MRNEMHHGKNPCHLTEERRYLEGLLCCCLLLLQFLGLAHKLAHQLLAVIPLLQQYISHIASCCNTYHT